MSCPGGRVLLAAALCYRGRFCICVAHHFLSMANRGEGQLCYMSIRIAGHCTSAKSTVRELASWRVGKADAVHGNGSEESRSGGRSADIGGGGALVLFGL